MADSGFSVTIDNKDTLRKIEKLLGKVKKPKPLLTIIGRYIQAQTKKMFIGRRPDINVIRGEKWGKLAEFTIRKKEQLKAMGKLIGSPRRPLVQTGALKRSLLRKGSLKVDNRGLEYGTEVKSDKGFSYPALHQVGKRKMPKRRFLFITEQELYQIANTTAQWLKGLRIKKMK